MPIFAVEWTVQTWAIVLSIALFSLILIPYLFKEIRDGKRELGPLRRLRRGHVELGPRTPVGAGDNNPGRVGDPAPGEPSGQPDPYGERARRMS